MLNMEKLTELTKMPGAAVQLQQFVQQQENFQKQDRCAKTNCKTAGHFAKNIVRAIRTGEKFEHFFCRGHSKLAVRIYL